MHASPIDELIDFWFGPLEGPASLNRDRYDMWFTNGRAYDAAIRDRFGALWQQAADGALDAWAETPRGRLALILLLDQGSRHIHRGTPRAFEQDLYAQALTLEGIELGHDRALLPLQRSFFYLPLEHAEDINVQHQSLEAFTDLADEAPPELAEDFASFLDYARRHLDVIRRFGRFPDLNAILGRESTPEEREFLQQPGSAFL